MLIVRLNWDAGGGIHYKTETPTVLNNMFNIKERKPK